MAELLEKRIVGGQDKRAIRILAGGIQSNSLVLSRLSRSKGLVINNDTIRDWDIETVITENGDTLFIGPDFEGQSLDEVCSSDTSRGLTALLIVSRAFAHIEERHDSIPCPLSSGILISKEESEDGGTVHILPPELARRALRSRGPGARSSAVAFLRSSRAEGFGAEAAFLLAQMIYRTASGQSAYSAEAGAQEIAHGSFLPLREHCPGLDAGLARAVDQTLENPRAMCLARLVSALQAASSAGWYRELSPEEEDRFARQLAISQVKLSNRKRLEVFWRTKKNLVAGIGIGSALILVLALSLADARRGKPNYSDRSPFEIAQTYYRAVAALDIDSIEACAERDAAKPDLDHVSMVTVVTKMRQAYEGKNPIIKAEDWFHSGQPKLSADQVLYGFTGLALVEVEKRDGEARFRADYTSWAVDRSEYEDSDDFPIIKGFVTDDLHLEYKGTQGWRITRIDRTVR